MCDDELRDLASRAQSLGWSWHRRDWDSQVRALGLVPKGEAGTRLKYATSAGTQAWAYTDGSQVLTLKFELVALPNTRSISSEVNAATWRSLSANFERTVDAATASLGTPQFVGDPLVPGFPVDQDAARLAIWPLQGARFMLQLVHTDPDAPMLLMIVIAPPGQGH